MERRSFPGSSLGQAFLVLKQFIVQPALITWQSQLSSPEAFISCDRNPVISPVSSKAVLTGSKHC